MTRGRADEGTQNGVGRLRGSTNPRVAPLASPFLQVAPRWVWGACGVFSQLSRGFGPSNMCACSWLVRGEFPWIDDVSWTHGLLCGSTSPCGPVWVTLDPHDILYISLSSELQIRQMIYPFWSSRRAHWNGAVQIGIWGYLWWHPIHTIDSLALDCIIPCAFWCVMQQNTKTPTLVEIVSISPYSSVYAHFLFILCRNWRPKSGT
jgi:hypothetical protein